MSETKNIDTAGAEYDMTPLVNALSRLYAAWLSRLPDGNTIYATLARGERGVRFVFDTNVRTATLAVTEPNAEIAFVETIILA